MNCSNVCDRVETEAWGQYQTWRFLDVLGSRGSFAKPSARQIVEICWSGFRMPQNYSNANIYPISMFIKYPLIITVVSKF